MKRYGNVTCDECGGELLAGEGTPPPVAVGPYPCTRNKPGHPEAKPYWDSFTSG